MNHRRFYTALLALGLSLTTWMASAVAAPPHAPPRVARAFAPAGSHANPLTPRQAIDLHARMAMQQDIAFRYLPDGCHARAHLMIRKMQTLGVQAGKVWAFPHYQGEALTAPGGITWSFHVAPVVRVRYPNGDFDMVIDPSMFRGPVTVHDWARPMTTAAGHFPYLYLTPSGGRPVLPNGKVAAGSYEPWGADPFNVDGAAMALMADYKGKEPH